MVFLRKYNVFIDSKALKPEKREELFESLKENEKIGYVLRIISPEEISANMLRPYIYFLLIFVLEYHII